MNVKFTLHNQYIYKKYTLENNIDSVPENIHNLERCFEHNLLRTYQFIIYIQGWFSAGQKGISAARRGETGEKVFLP